MVLKGLRNMAAPPDQLIAVYDMLRYVTSTRGEHTRMAILA